VTQKGSLVEPSRLRFDFSHFEPLTAQQILIIEQRVNEKIIENSDAHIKEMAPDEAIKAGAMALFGEKYGDKVRVLNMGNGYSVELCGGTHVDRTGDIGMFKITSEAGIAAGVRRIEGITGMDAFNYLAQADNSLQQIVRVLKADRLNVDSKLAAQLDRLKELEKDNLRLKAQLASQSGGDLSSEAIEINDVKLLVKKLTNTDPQIMRSLVDDLKNKLGKAIIVLATVNEDKVQLIVGVTNNCTDKIAAGDLVNFVAQQVGGKGGGRRDLAQAGGTQPQALDKALSAVHQWIRERI
jgi:alanyl-tRNA synthetase